MPHYSERFGTALSVLAGHGDIKSRLTKAFDEHLNDIDDATLPGPVQRMFCDLRERMTSVAPANGEGPVCASVRKMSIVEADSCARTLVDLYSIVLTSDRPIGVVEQPVAEDAPAVPAVLLKTV